MSRKTSRNPKSLADLPISVHEGLCNHEALRRLGFDSSDIYVGFAPMANPSDGRIYPRGPRAGQPVPANCGSVIVRLETQGRTFTIDYPDQDLTRPQFNRIWIKAGKLWNRSTDAESGSIWRSSWIYANGLGLITSLLNKGFYLPVAVGLRKPADALHFLTITPEA